jgi:putative transposase
MPVRYNTQSAQLKDIRSLRPELARWSFSSQQATLRRLDKAFGAFFRRVASGETPRYPGFRAAHRFDSVEWPATATGAGRSPRRAVSTSKVSECEGDRPPPGRGTGKTVHVHREGRASMLVLSCDDVALRLLEPTGAVVGVEVGIASFAVTSEGHHIDNPRSGAKAASKLRCPRGPRSKEAGLE